MKSIPLTKGFVALVDDEDYERLAQYKWTYYRSKRGNEYAIHYFRQNGKIKGIYMHRDILCVPAGKEIDHKNGNGLDNQKANLRLATRSENSRNARLKRNAASGYKCVRPNRSKWQAYITINGRCVALGTFVTKEEAARAYDSAARQQYGEFARLNFPDENQ